MVARLVEKKDYLTQPNKDLAVKWSDIILLHEPWKGVTVRVGAVSFFDDENGDPHGTFDYEIIDRKRFKERKLRKDKKFVAHVGHIILSMLEDHLEGGTKDNEIGDDYIEEPDLQRRVRSKSPAVPKK